MFEESFADRQAAGRALASRLSALKGRAGAMVLALPRGGVPVGYEVARALEMPLDVFVVRKLGVPGREEYAMGAIAGGGVRVVDGEVCRVLGISEAQLEEVARREQKELERRERLYRGNAPALALRERTIVLIDDGLATGSTMHAAVLAARLHDPSRIVVAAPVASRDACARLRAVADDVVCVATPAHFHAVGQWYADFSQTGDDEVQALLARAREERAARPAGPDDSA